MGNFMDRLWCCYYFILDRLTCYESKFDIDGYF